MPPFGKHPEMIVHEERPFNAEAPLHRLRKRFQTPLDLFFSRNHGSVPEVHPGSYRLSVGGLVDRPSEFSMEDLRGLPSREVEAVMECAGNRRDGLMRVAPTPGETPWGAGAAGNASWVGVPLREVLLAAGVGDGARHAAFVGLDLVEGEEGNANYGGSIPLEKALSPEVLLAYEMNGEALTPEHGAPLRIVAPGYYGARSVKWLSSITLQEDPSDNHFQAREYKLFPPGVTAEEVNYSEGLMLGELQTNSVVCEPGEGEELEVGPVPVRGYAVAGGGRRVERVDVSPDGGQTWVQADLTDSSGEPWAWTLWEATVELGFGEHHVVVRALDSSAATQPATAEEVWNFKGYANNSWHGVRVEAVSMSDRLSREQSSHDYPEPLDIDLAAPEPIPEEGIDRVTQLMRTGTLFRYAEVGEGQSEAALWEEEFADFIGRKYAIAVTSCGTSLFLALHCLGIHTGDPVLVNSWTLAPVPGAVQHAGGRAVLVETTLDLTVDLDDLEAKARQNPGSVLLLSHMRGHIADMDAIASICDQYELTLVEDCAHSIGASWNGQTTGTFGAVGCFSTQTYKHLNSGEGGLIVTDDDEIAARAILASGSYMLYEQHTSRPPAEQFDDFVLYEPNHSIRITNTAAAVLRPQLRSLPERVHGWNARYARLEEELSTLPGLRLPRRSDQEDFVGSSLQFFLDELTPEQITSFCAIADKLGVHVKWFGAPRPVGFTSTYRSWSYTNPTDLSRTDRVLAQLCDIRVPLALPLERCDDVVAILRHALDTVRTVPSQDD